MYHQLELARSGEALFKVRGKYLKYVGSQLAYMASRSLRYFTITYDNIS
jgi:hypothetical protein